MIVRFQDTAPVPATAERDLCRVVRVLIGAFVVGIVVSWPLWLGRRTYPLAPLFPGLPGLAVPWDAVLPGAAVLALVAAVVWRRVATGVFLLLVLALFVLDQNRGQPWVYLYSVLLLLSLFPAPTALAGIRGVLSIAYFWAAMQKLNPAYFTEMPRYLVEPLWAAGAPGIVVRAGRGLVALGPLVELAIAVGLWVPRARPAALFLVAALHGLLLLVLGPLGLDVNRAVWPWNVAMGVLVWMTFRRADARQDWEALRRSTGALVVAGCVAIGPVLSFVGAWDSYFSFALYSENTARVDILMSGPVRRRLPVSWRRWVVPAGKSPDGRPAWRLALVHWSDAEFGAPGLPEPRVYRRLGALFEGYAAEAGEVRVKIWAGRGGKEIEAGKAGE